MASCDVIPTAFKLADRVFTARAFWAYALTEDLANSHAFLSKARPALIPPAIAAHLRTNLSAIEVLASPVLAVASCTSPSSFLACTMPLLSNSEPIFSVALSSAMRFPFNLEP